MKNVILMHGKNTNPSEKWYPWLEKEISKFGVNFIAPILPNANDPEINEWINELGKTNPDKYSILIGHSRGGVAILRWLETQSNDFKVKKVILVATNSGDSEKRNKTKNNKGFFSEDGYDFEKIKKHCDDFVILHSRDDKWVDFKNGEENARGLNAKFLKFKNRGHFGSKLSVQEIPELLEEIINFNTRKALIVPINKKQEILIQDRQNWKKPDWGYFGGGIEHGEKPIETVIRETKEELDIDIKPGDLKNLGVSTTIRGGCKHIRYMYLYPTDQKSFNVLEGDGAHWLAFDKAGELLDIKNRFNETVEKIKKYL
ncbi:NUDIX domain-containing protein [Candidatus Falkowbacteria bacterium]|nr:NUDIX domain-containing protein [Candidatus Falkowbacteria bacterium]MBT4432897.1 NUDIX domain-containing protein [Candidatus Falkowbacteria bacterium]